MLKNTFKIKKIDAIKPRAICHSQLPTVTLDINWEGMQTTNAFVDNISDNCSVIEMNTEVTFNWINKVSQFVEIITTDPSNTSDTIQKEVIVEDQSGNCPFNLTSNLFPLQYGTFVVGHSKDIVFNIFNTLNGRADGLKQVFIPLSTGLNFVTKVTTENGGSYGSITSNSSPTIGRQQIDR